MHINLCPIWCYFMFYTLVPFTSFSFCTLPDFSTILQRCPARGNLFLSLSCPVLRNFNYNCLHVHSTYYQPGLGLVRLSCGGENTLCGRTSVHKMWKSRNARFMKLNETTHLLIFLHSSSWNGKCNISAFIAYIVAKNERIAGKGGEKIALKMMIHWFVFA